MFYDTLTFTRQKGGQRMMQRPKRPERQAQSVFNIGSINASHSVVAVGANATAELTEQLAVQNVLSERLFSAPAYKIPYLKK